ncbi:hypothetical protein N656DRAFT_89510 [Canariomyces notabilis]|uniref:Uncharacterized protein n=1 Tax=Canariomyces notabilis TaxID=2074819 RepID=A0AAN6TDM4_9PEZI|nr:hypothetical protein N656DRAFT_89510 [Canariomyces arenarius]
MYSKFTFRQYLLLALSFMAYTPWTRTLSVSCLFPSKEKHFSSHNPGFERCDYAQNRCRSFGETPRTDTLGIVSCISFPPSLSWWNWFARSPSDSIAYLVGHAHHQRPEA